MVTDDELRRLDDLAQKATPGPLFQLHEGQEHSTCHCAQVWSEAADHPVAYCDTREHDEGFSYEQQMANARYIAAACNTVPGLIADLRAERERIRQYEAMAHLMVLDVCFPSFEGHGFFRPSDTEGKRIAFNVLCSDTFAYACADREGITLEKAPEMLRLYREGGWPAVSRWVQEQRGGPEASPFIKPVAEQMREDKALREELRAERERWRKLREWLDERSCAAWGFDERLASRIVRERMDELEAGK